MPTFDLTDDETIALTRLVRRAIDEDRFPLSPRLDPLKSIFCSWRTADKPLLRVTRAESRELRDETHRVA